MSEKIASLYAEITAKTDGLETGLGKTKKEIDELDKEFIKARASIASLSEKTVGLRGNIDSFSSMLEGATPENRKYAESFLKIKDDFEKGNISITDAKEKIAQLKAEMGPAAQETTSFGTKLKEFATKAALVVGSVAAVAAAIKKVYDVAKEGAEIELTATRFETLAENAGTTADVLENELTKAIGGLMSKSESMALVTEIMSLGLVDTTDQAVRLAKIVSQLGADMNQVTLTLANQTTMRFDQIGIAIDGFDEKLQDLKDSGMDANAAFTEAFLQQGEAQINKIGSIADTSAGKMAQFESAIKDTTDAIKELLAQPISNLLDPITEQLVVTNKINGAVEDGVITQRDAINILHQYRTGQLDYADTINFVNKKIDEYNAKQAESIRMFTPYNEWLYETKRNTDKLVASEEDLAKIEEERQARIDARISMQESMNAAFEAGTERIQKQTDAYNNLATSLKGVNFKSNADSQLDFYEKLRESGAITEEQYKGLTKQILISSGQASEKSYALADAQSYANEMMVSGLSLTTEQISQLPGILATVSSDGVTSMSELQTAFINAGLTTQEEVDKMNNIDLGEATTAASNLATQLTTITDLPSDKTFTYKINIITTGNVGLLTSAMGSNNSTTISGYTGGGAQGIGYASGGSFEIPPGYNNDSYYLGSGHWGQSGETVTVTPSGQTPTQNIVVNIDYEKFARAMIRQGSRVA